MHKRSISRMANKHGILPSLQFFSFSDQDDHVLWMKKEYARLSWQMYHQEVRMKGLVYQMKVVMTKILCLLSLRRNILKMNQTTNFNRMTRKEPLVKITPMNLHQLSAQRLMPKRKTNVKPGNGKMMT